MRVFDTSLPIDAVLGELTAALRARPNAVLVAPPGAGKTTRVPLVLLDEPWVDGGKIIVLEPRRLAARAAAARMAQTLGEAVGETVGLRVRLGSKISRRTRIEVVTEGVFARMILDDPSLDGVAAVLFDEFHERSLDADLGLALALDAQGGLREDLRLLVMSATLDGARVAKLLSDAPVVESEGRAYPVETRYHGRDPNRRIEEQVTDAVTRALRAESGSLLVFLPGQGEIRRVETFLRERVSDPTVDIAPLYGALERGEQDLAVSPAKPGRRKVVLATSIAETSLTIEGVRVVIDSGLARVPVYEPNIGLTRLETVRVSRAAADQRRGRAGRTEPGVCYRLWEEAATGALEPFARPEILSADLAPLLLDCAAWGVTDPMSLAFLDPPPAPALKEARALLQQLGALDAQGRITETGRRLRDLPLPPRLARMVMTAGETGQAREAAEIAAVLVERGLGGDAVDLAERVERFRRDRSGRAQDMRRMAEAWAKGGNGSGSGEPHSIGALLTLAYPDRIAKARGKTGEYLMANGRGAVLEAHERLAREPYLAIAEIAGGAASARILAAAAIAPEAIESLFGATIEQRDEVAFDRQARALRARGVRRLGALLLNERPLKVPATEEAARALAEGLVSIGLDALPWSKALAQWRERVMFLRKAEGEEWPDLSDETLDRTAEEWLAPHLVGKNGLSDLGPDLLSEALRGLLPWNLQRRLDAEAPTHIEVPTGSQIPIDYGAEEGPVLAVRVQELFGLDKHPTIAAGRAPLILHLLSPAHRPIQITRDLPGFWRGSWAAVRADMRGQYPKHPWPEDPLTAPPTRRAKPRGT
ncbi:ATP-dependent helicase HrpB [Microvirga lotononidis]|uniref:ATP-dependent helicase HrpB n=1 Tax=Microvirga lotononidis TaxID=864069 RepID=I4YTY1_9HYPH|nr:ATP-dependent helicase HrpB [Microvirga lotononidis]EIM27423.1 ATP-dependent helicase HrpB [Microvirga lotononidis]WQO28416.1 ATP-dependent helicase HrpB [Microvirga lotononidis]